MSSNLVLTTRGLVEFSRLEVSDIVEVGDNYRKIIAQYRLDGEVVRQSVFVDGLRPCEAGTANGSLNGR